MKFYFNFILLLLAGAIEAQEVTVSGSVSDEETGETLIGATVAAPSLGLGTTTNEYGFYSLSIPRSDTAVELVFSYVGFQSQLASFLPKADTVLSLGLSTGVQLEEVVVKANSYQEQMSSTEMSVEAISTREAKLVPVLLGESDILKTVQLKPGIPSGSEGRTGLFVRGGAGDQNLIVLDEAIVYNANHLFGFFSTFNTDAVKDLKIYKGGFPAQYGGRLSSVIDVKLKEGNNQKFSGSGGLGLISSRLTLEGPIQKGKSSFIVSGRRTYVDLLTRGVNRANEGNEDFTPIPDYYFYDLNAKVNHQFGEKDRLFLSGYFGRDVFGFNSDFFNFDFDWGNATGTARWNHVFSPKLFANTTFTYSDYQYNIRNEVTGFSFGLGSDIQDATLKTDFYFAPNNRHTMRFGVMGTHHTFTVGRLQAGSDDGVVSFSAGQEFDGVEFGTYFADEMELSDELSINAGIRLSGFSNDGKTYFGLEPRVAARYRVSDRVSAKASYARMYQYLHLIANAGVALPTDIWYPSTSRVRPQRSDQVAAGFSYLLGDQYFINVEGYHKWLANQLQFVDGAQIFVNDELEEEFAVGEGRAYGLEFSIEKKQGRLTGWVGYTLALTRLQNFETLDPNGRFAQESEGFGPFSPIYDRRHDISVVGIYEISRRFTASVTFVYGSGDLSWLPPGRFTFQDVPGAGFEAVVPDYRERNNFRLPAYHRLDLGLVYKFFPKWGKSDLTLSVVNAYDRRNAFFIFLEPSFEAIEGTDIEVPTGIAAKQVSLFPILPSLTWNFEF
ncbi:TonB-dependent receptor [Phaeodactylibacter luteus]|uniref:TonB-dependent receptor n=1 Tax=Phaeodactylibacter luteus TaxID=1564516 RepID=A0A5C6RLQ5_9BACT|nr:TonB-dependent receptor [Phaeodactylibacter luteus]TXB62895.1 TonB-dependent receptor [Phaeodactylibacter luteus]